MATARLSVTPSGAALGAEITGIDVRALNARCFEFLYDAWLLYEVLVVRDQQLSDDDLISFSRRFGDLDLAPIQENGRRFVEGHPEIYVVSNVIENGVAIGSLGAGEAIWHTDMSYLPVPPKASLLYALEVPAHGGDTSFCTMRGACDELPPSLRGRAISRRVKHDGTYNSGGYVREGVTPTDDLRQAPGTLHPLVCRHRETGRPHLYLGRRRNAYVDDLPTDASNELLDQLWEFATSPRFTWTHRWRVGDLVLWDNRTTMHRRDAFDPSDRRLMHRTQVRDTVAPAPITRNAAPPRARAQE
ncbi:MAG TPA: TauD/TfdA family dioxygenase [Vicinamibacterales bacterium]|nr:TauD/TfdA family dioxygenase [Vicinamibacterales bacterium]